jgi:hypothetical protein
MWCDTDLTEKNQTLSAVIDIHVRRKTITEACVGSDDACVCSSPFVYLLLEVAENVSSLAFLKSGHTRCAYRQMKG